MHAAAVAHVTSALLWCCGAVNMQDAINAAGAQLTGGLLHCCGAANLHAAAVAHVTGALLLHLCVVHSCMCTCGADENLCVDTDGLLRLYCCGAVHAHDAQEREYFKVHATELQRIHAEACG